MIDVTKGPLNVAWKVAEWEEEEAQHCDLDLDTWYDLELVQQGKVITKVKVAELQHDDLPWEKESI